MNMQDKEFDDLFRSKLDDLEMEPSAQVWAGIDATLDGKKRRSMIPMLGIAASMVILIAAAILFIPKGEIVKPGKKPVVKNALATNHTNPIITKPVEASVNAIKREGIQPKDITGNASHIAMLKHKNAPEVAFKPIEQPAAIIEIKEPLKADDQPVLASNQVPETPVVNKAVVPDVNTPLATKQDVNDGQTAIVKPVLAAIQPNSTQQAKTIPKRHGIHSFGDLVNIVVAKVDKRKDKLIEFSDSDDDESVISAVNAGIVKIKKDK